jgi:thiosulfate/3-mercaptopyruvate sulfurtransferase
VTTGIARLWSPDEIHLPCDPNTLIADARPPDDYLRAHLPNALSLFYGAFVNRMTGGFLAASAIAMRLGERGVGSALRIALYDDGTGVLAGKTLQALDAVGHLEVAILNGGIAAWLAAGGVLTDERRERAPTVYDLKAPGDPFATKEWILANLARDDLAIVDTRSLNEYRAMDRRALRNGRIPDAVHFEWTDALYLDERRVPRFIPARELRTRLESKGITPEKEIVCYCQSGTRSSSFYAALRTLGYSRVRNYLGSWAEWGNDPKTPVEVP